MQPLRTILIDPSRLSREGLRDILDAKGIEVVGEAASIAALDGAGAPAPDLILADPGHDPLSVREDLRELRARQPDARIVALSGNDSPTFLQACFEAPIDGLISKNVSSAILLKSLDLVLAGERVFPSQMIARLIRENVPSDPLPTAASIESTPLSERELQIIRCLVAGWSNKRIALSLSVTEATVKVHLKSILRKTHVRNRTQAAIWALAQGIRASEPGGRDP